MHDLISEVRRQSEILSQNPDTPYNWFEARALDLANEVERLNKWADGFSDRQLKERASGEEYQRELRVQIAILQHFVDGGIIEYAYHGFLNKWYRVIKGHNINFSDYVYRKAVAVPSGSEREENDT